MSSRFALSGLWGYGEVFDITVCTRYRKLSGGICMAAVDVLDYRIPVYGDRECLPTLGSRKGFLPFL